MPLLCFRRFRRQQYSMLPHGYWSLFQSVQEPRLRSSDPLSFPKQCFRSGDRPSPAHTLHPDLPQWLKIRHFRLPRGSGCFPFQIHDWSESESCLPSHPSSLRPSGLRYLTEYLRYFLPGSFLPGQEFRPASKSEDSHQPSGRQSDKPPLCHR